MSKRKFNEDAICSACNVEFKPTNKEKCKGAGNKICDRLFNLYIFSLYASLSQQFFHFLSFVCESCQNGKNGKQYNCRLCPACMNEMRSNGKKQKNLKTPPFSQQLDRKGKDITEESSINQSSTNACSGSPETGQTSSVHQSNEDPAEKLSTELKSAKELNEVRPSESSEELINKSSTDASSGSSETGQTSSVHQSEDDSAKEPSTELMSAKESNEVRPNEFFISDSEISSTKPAENLEECTKQAIFVEEFTAPGYDDAIALVKSKIPSLQGGLWYLGLNPCKRLIQSDKTDSRMSYSFECCVTGDIYLLWRTHTLPNQFYLEKMTYENFLCFEKACFVWNNDGSEIAKDDSNADKASDVIADQDATNQSTFIDKPCCYCQKVKLFQIYYFSS